MGGLKINEIIVGDAIHELRKLPDKSIDLIVTDPPYNLKKDYGDTKDNLEFNEYLEFSRKWLKECKRVLKDDGTIYVFMGMRFISYIYRILEIELDMKFCSWITWYYTQGIGKTKGFSPRHDDILMFTKTKKYKFNLDDIRIPQKYYRSVNNMRGANPGNVWEFSHIHYCNSNRMKHPTQKPEGLYERIILASSNPGDIVLDPFMGSGTCARVCQQLQRNWLGFEINNEYANLIETRLKQPFKGFDSIDEKILRVPNDLNDLDYRKEYINNHIKWFLKNHQDCIPKFIENVKQKYGDDYCVKLKTKKQKNLSKQTPNLFNYSSLEENTDS
ncbi:MAG: site-specific DNA-methyltransferase [Erysipelotrichaceae bacterium]|nr:site-specific DNA-methyltransferase [Erysipelotrichaceae bacterium]